MSGVNPLNILQSIERKKSFKQRGLRQPGELLKLPPVNENEVEGEEEDEDLFLHSQLARHPNRIQHHDDENEDVDRENSIEDSIASASSFRVSKAAVVPLADGVPIDEYGDEVDPDARKKSKVGATRDPNETTAVEKRWKKVRIAAKTLVQLKSLENDLRLYGAKHEEEMLDDPNDPRYYVRDISKQKKWYILLPQSRVRGVWQLFVVLMLFYVVITVPVRVCFDLEVEQGGAATFDQIVDIIFILDVFVNCFCAYVSKSGEVVVEHKAIVLQYAKTWMLVDVVASIPFSQFIESDLESVNRLGKLARLPKFIRLIRLLRLLKLLRVFRLVRYFNHWENYSSRVNVGMARMFKISFGVFMVTHLIGCFWYLVSWAGYDSIHPESWVARHGIQDDEPVTKYLTSVYWSFSTLTTVGFGDISARTNVERIFSIVCMVVGVSWYAFVVSTISSIISMFDRRNAEMKKKQRLILQFMKETKVPWDLRRRILSYFEYLSSRESLDNDNKEMANVLAMLSTQLRTEVTLHVHRNLIPRIPFFDNKTPQFIAACVSLLKPLHFRPGDYISTRGQHADEMYFIVTGRAIVVLPNGKKFKSIVPGSYFGEIGCMLSEIHRVSIVAATECEVYALTKQDLKDLMSDYPDVADEIRSTAKKRIEHLNRKDETESKEGRSARNIATSFPGVSFDENSEEPEEKDFVKDQIKSAGRSTTRETLVSNASYMSLSDSLFEADSTNEADSGSGNVSLRLHRMEVKLDSLRNENKELKSSLESIRFMLAQVVSKAN